MVEGTLLALFGIEINEFALGAPPPHIQHHLLQLPVLQIAAIIFLSDKKVRLNFPSFEAQQLTLEILVVIA